MGEGGRRGAALERVLPFVPFEVRRGGKHIPPPSPDTHTMRHTERTTPYNSLGKVRYYTGVPVPAGKRRECARVCVCARGGFRGGWAKH